MCYLLVTVMLSTSGGSGGGGGGGSSGSKLALGIPTAVPAGGPGKPP